MKEILQTGSKTLLLPPRKKMLATFAAMLCLMAWMMPARAQQQPPFTVTTPDDVTNHNETLYWLEANGATGFYAIPHTNNSNVSTTNMPNLKALWYFMDASDGYYYIVNHSTGLYLKLDGTLGQDETIKLASFGSGGDDYKFSVTGSDGQWSFCLKSKSGSTSYYVNKKTNNVSYTLYLKASSYYDANSKWNIVARNSVTWAHPFSNSTNDEKHYYNIHNATPKGSAFYMSIDDASDPYAIVSNVDDNKRVWYFMEADSDDAIPNLKYYYIVNAITGKYLKFTKTANGNSQTSSLQLYEHNGTETGEAEDRFQFMVLNATGKDYSAYSIMPKLEISNYDNKNASLSPSDNYSNSLSNGMKIGIYNDRGQDNNYAHWTIEETVLVLVNAPTITNNFDGTISLSTTTPGATIYYTNNGDTPDNNSTEYEDEPFALGNATVIKAIAYLDPEYSIVSTYNVPKLATPTISYDNSTSEVTITCDDATGIYYTTDGSIPTTSSTPYSTPFTVSTGVTIKAIATHAGYLNSDVATRYIQGNNYSQNYLTFDVRTGGTIVWKAFCDSQNGEIIIPITIEYSINGGDWIQITSSSSGESFTVDENDVIRFRGTNTTYATSKSNYSGFDGGTASFNIEGNIMSLTAGNNFANVTTLPGTWTFCSLFKQSKAVSAENLILPATSLTECCYRAMFSKCTTLQVAPALPATTLGAYCYYYMFEDCAITTAPELRAPTLVPNCYGNMFTGCTSLNYILCLAVNKTASGCLTNWVNRVSSTGTFVKDEDATWSTGVSGIPTNWTVVNDGTPNVPTISCDGFDIELSCTTTGAIIYYQLDHSGNYTQYTAPITMTDDTFIECYSEKDGKTSATISQTCEYDDRTIYEYSNQSLDSWIYRGNTITTPYSVNAIDGHSQSYAKGTFTFETDVNLRSQQPTYLWFQHADQSADIYVDNTYVTTHWGGYNAFFVDISNYVHQGTNRIKVVLNNKTRNTLAPASGDFNFNATLGKVKLFTSLCLPAMDYGYDGFHVIATDVSSSSATVTVKTKIPVGASVVCTISDGTYNWTDTQNSTGNEQSFTTTIQNPHLWNGTLDPHLYNIKLEIYKDNKLYHSYERPYGLRFYEYVINDTNKVGTAQNPYTGFLLNGQPYLLRGCCMHDDIAGKANALNDDDYAQTFSIIQELGNNFLRLAHYPHPKEVYDWCDRLGIVVQTEVPCVNKLESTMPEDYWTHLVGQYDDMVNQHYNHPCIMFWGLSNEAKVDDASFAKTKIEGYVSQIKALDSERMVGLVGHALTDPLSYFGNPTTIDWIGSNLYVGWYSDGDSNNPTSKLNTCITKTVTNAGKAYAFSEYGGGGTQRCHSENPSSTTNKGSGGERHDIEYQMRLHEGHIAAIKNKPELLFSSEWQLFDIAVSNRNEGYTVCLDGENTTIDDELRRLNDKGLVERDHKTKKDTYYLYKAWWNQTDIFVHICGKNYLKTEDRVIKCYTNDGNELTLYVNGVFAGTATVTNNIATFTARNFSDGDVITVSGARSEDTFTIHSYGENVFVKEGNWNTDSNWSGSEVPDDGSDVLIAAKATIPANSVVDVDKISVIPGATLTIADGGQLFHNNSGVTATVQKNIAAHGTTVAEGGWNFIATPITNGTTPSTANGILSSPENSYDLFFYDEPNHYWRNYKTYGDNTNPNFDLSNGQGYLYANAADTQIEFTGTLRASNEAYTNNLSYTSGIGNLAGFNLVGNPFACNAIVDKPCYIIQDGVIVATTGTVAAPCSGVMVKATDTDQSVTFTRTTDAAAFSTGRNQLNITIANNNMAARGERSMIDNAIISFNENSQLEKFYFGTQNANIYIPQNGEEYAIVSIGRDVSGNVSTNEMPLNFKATENGNYTLMVSPEGVDLNYLHLIDNLTGADVDLLALRPFEGPQGPQAQGPAEYTFKAKTTDYASRFKLIFSTNSEDGPSTGSGTFAFIDAAGNIVITDGPSTGSGTYTLQVIDMMGRIIVTRGGRIQCVPTSGMTPGVYVLRLISGNDVKTQKIVVR